mmetsp:Transcript_67069/g.158250  ORF Transcript_67069/g.158250 Transcript_67069/m.158250 type:complete len:231 (+) Transcript_67069:304-996(+)
MIGQASPRAHFIELGSFIGGTLAYVGVNYPHVRVTGCEPELGSYVLASELIYPARNTTQVLRMTSEEMLPNLDRLLPDLMDTAKQPDTAPIFFVDSHTFQDKNQGSGYAGKLPLILELEAIARYPNSWVVIDDTCLYEAPEEHQLRQNFGCIGGVNMFSIGEGLRSREDRCVFYPNYVVRTTPCAHATGFANSIGWVLVGVGEVCSHPAVANAVAAKYLLRNDAWQNPHE